VTSLYEDLIWFQVKVFPPPENTLIWGKTKKNNKETLPEHYIFKKGKWYLSDETTFLYYDMTEWAHIISK
jgi:hypothetical protein